MGHGRYVLSAHAHPVSMETNASNNNFIEGTYKLAKYGDAKRDGVSVLDLTIIVTHLGKFPP